MTRKLIAQIPLDEAVAIAQRKLLPEGLNSLQEEILRKSWSGETYDRKFNVGTSTGKCFKRSS